MSEIAEVYIWVLSGVLALLLSVVLIAGRIIANNIGTKFDDLLTSINKLSSLTVQQTEQIKTLFMNKEETARRLNFFAERQRELELEVIKLKHSKNGNIHRNKESN